MFGPSDKSLEPARMTDRIQTAIGLVDPLTLSKAITGDYDNRSLGVINDHEIRMSVMTAQYRWHRHPDSDETFFGVEGELIIEFSDREVSVKPGQFLTVPAGTLHRTRPAGPRSVNLTFERIGAATIFEEWSTAVDRGTSSPLLG